MKQKLIFLDIDGTLLPMHTVVPPDSALNAIRAAQSRGHKVFLCTGRNMRRAAPVAAYGFDGILACAGGYIVCGEKIIHDQSIEETQLNALLQVLHRNNVTYFLQARNSHFSNIFFACVMWPKLREKNAFFPMSQYKGQPVYKVSFLCRKRQQLQEAINSFGGQFSFCFNSINVPRILGKVNGEIIAMNSDKGAGIKRVCEYLGVPIEDSIGFGDSMNDLSMIQTAGIGVCMDNGCEELKAVCDRVCPPADRDGLAIGFQELGLI